MRRRFGARLRQLREQGNLSQEALAERAELDRKTVSRVETGTHAPNLDHVFALAVGLHVEPIELFRFPGPGGSLT